MQEPESLPSIQSSSGRALALRLVLGLIVSGVFLWLFNQLAEDVVTRDAITHFDQALANALHQLATPVSTLAFQVISALGSPVLTVLVIGMTLFYLLRRHWRHALIWVVAFVGGQGLNWLLKQLFARPRPYFTDPLVVEANYSFPSGHAMWSFIVYGLLAYFALIDLPNRGARWLAIAGAAFLIFMIGLSRIYLGVHYFSDVLGGYIAAAVWLSACITGMEALRHSKPRDLQDPAQPHPPLTKPLEH